MSALRVALVWVVTWVMSMAASGATVYVLDVESVGIGVVIGVVFAVAQIVLFFTWLRGRSST